MEAAFSNQRGLDTNNTLARLLRAALCCLGLRVLDQEELSEGNCVCPKIKSSASSGHQVFINHKGPDAKNTLSSLLYEALCRSGLRVFLDREELNTSNCVSPLTAIKSSKGRRMEVKRGEKTLAAGITGQEYLTAGGEGLELIFKIVGIVLEKVRKESLWVTEHPVGLEEAAKKLYEDISQEMEASAGTTIVGLAGLGGSGKTALVTHLFNSKPDKFKKFFFLCADSENQSKLTTLQEKMLFDLLGCCPLSVWDTKIGASLLRERLKVLCQAQVMIVLNGVDSQEQIDNLLLLVKDVLGKGSLILITSGDKDLLGHCQVIYNKKLLVEKEAEELIRQYAFHTSSVLTVSEDLVRKMMKKCGGYPFAVKVLTGQLSGKEESDWNQRLKMLEKAQFPNEIFEKMVKPSYNPIHKEAKMVFLEFAFFVEGLDMDLVVRFHPEVECRLLDWIEPLGQKCLV